MQATRKYVKVRNSEEEKPIQVHIRFTCLKPGDTIIEFIDYGWAWEKEEEYVCERCYRKAPRDPRVN